VPLPAGTPGTVGALPPFLAAKLAAGYGPDAPVVEGPGVDPTDLWLRRWWACVEFRPALWQVPRCRRRGGHQAVTGRKFVEKLASLYEQANRGVIPYAAPLVFRGAVLARVDAVRAQSAIARVIADRLAMWERGEIDELVLTARRSGEARRAAAGRRPPPDPEHVWRVFSRLMLRGQTTQANRWLTRRCGDAAVFSPDDPDPEGRLHADGSPWTVADVLGAKHPPPAPVAPTDLIGDDGALRPLPVHTFTANELRETVADMQGAGGPTGFDVVALRDAMLCYGEASDRLCDALAAYTSRMANDAIPWPEIATMEAQLEVALRKANGGVRPVGVKEAERRLAAKVLLRRTGDAAQEACGTHNLCAGQRSGVEAGAAHMRQLWADAQDGDVLLFVDADNAFNRLKRRTALWTVRVLWPEAARFICNAYRGGVLVIVRGAGATTLLLCEEGTAQGCPVSMAFYAVGTLPAATALRDWSPPAPGRWEFGQYADDVGGGGTAEAAAAFFQQLQAAGPAVGLYPRDDKSWALVKGGPEHVERARAAFAKAGLRVQLTSEGRRYLGAWVGTEAGERAYVAEKAAAWEDCVHAFAGAARSFPHETFACVYRSLQAEWTYLLRVSPVAAELMAPVEQALAGALLPALAGRAISPWERRAWGLPTLFGGLGLLPPTDAPAAGDPYRASSEAVAWLVGAMRRPNTRYSRRLHEQTAGAAAAAYTARKEAWAEGVFAELTGAAPLPPPPPGLPPPLAATATKQNALVRQRRGRTGTWLNVRPSDNNDTRLSPVEWFDAMTLRTGSEWVFEAPDFCDGCGRRFSVRHAESCPVGGLVTRRHDDVESWVAERCREAGFATTRHPVVRHPQYEGGQRTLEGLEGDLEVHGLFAPRREAVLDVRLVDCDAVSYLHAATAAVLRRHEDSKRRLYQRPCTEARKDFTPFVVSVDGSAGLAAAAVLRRVGAAISRRTGAEWSRVAGTLRAGLQIACLRAASACMRTARQRRGPQIQREGGVALDTNGGALAFGAPRDEID
jgi:hypothetical protein